MGLLQRLLARLGGQAPSVSGGRDAAPGTVRPSDGDRTADLGPLRARGARPDRRATENAEETPDRVPDHVTEGGAVGAERGQSARPAVHTLLVGLGNPGAEYEQTRHNAGFLAVERLAERLGVALPDADPPRTRLADGVWDGRGVALAQPQAWMNRSGPPLAGLLEHYGLPAERVLLLYDDLALPPGQIRLRGKGSAGGHNGVQSVIDALGSSEFPRLRIGIGDRFERGGLVDYVLAPFPDDELDALDAALDLAAEAALAFAADGLSAAMNAYNRRA